MRDISFVLETKKNLIRLSQAYVFSCFAYGSAFPALAQVPCFSVKFWLADYVTFVAVIGQKERTHSSYGGKCLQWQTYGSIYAVWHPGTDTSNFRGVILRYRLVCKIKQWTYFHHSSQNITRFLPVWRKLALLNFLSMLIRPTKN